MTRFKLHPGTVIELSIPASSSQLFRASEGPSVVRYEIRGKVYGFVLEGREAGRCITVDYNGFR